MSDRISIDHINNTITIQVRTQDFSLLTNEQILTWVRKFIQDLASTSLQTGVIGDKEVSQ